MSHPVVAAERFLYSTLLADATLAAAVGTRIFGHTVPSGAVRPYVYFTSQGAGDDRMTLDAHTIWSQLLYTVRGVDKTESFPALEAIAAAIDDALHRASGSNVSGYVVGCVKERPFSLVEIDRDGAELRHLGSQFRLYVQ